MLRYLALALCSALLSVAFAAEGVLESADQFWKISLPTGWAELPLTPAQQGRVRAQAMAQDSDGTRSVAIAVRPDGRADPVMDQEFATAFIDKFIVESQRSGLNYTRGDIDLITWDTLPAAEITALLDDGDSKKAVLFRILAANGFVYQIRGIQERAEAIDSDLITVLAGFHLTKIPEPKSVEGGLVDEASGTTEGTAGADGTAPTTATSSGISHPLVIIGVIAGVAIVVVALLPLLKKKRKPRRSGKGTGRHPETDYPDELGTNSPPTAPRTTAARRTTVRMSPSQQEHATEVDRRQRPTQVTKPGRRTTVRMPPVPPEQPGPSADVRRRPPK